MLPPARLFVGRMLYTLRGAPLQGTTPLSVHFRKDLAWFHDFLPTYNGIQLIVPHRPVAHFFVYTTVSTLEAVWDNNGVVGPLPATLRGMVRLLATKELFTVLVGLALWGESWRGAELQIHTNVPSRLEVLVHGKSRDLAVLHMARAVWLYTARLDIRLQPLALSSSGGKEGSVREWAIPDVALQVLHDY